MGGMPEHPTTYIPGMFGGVWVKLPQTRFAYRKPLGLGNKAGELQPIHTG